MPDNAKGVITPVAGGSGGVGGPARSFGTGESGGIPGSSGSANFGRSNDQRQARKDAAEAINAWKSTPEDDSVAADIIRKHGDILLSALTETSTCTVTWTGPTAPNADAVELLAFADEFEGEAKGHRALGDHDEARRCIAAANALRDAAARSA